VKANLALTKKERIRFEDPYVGFENKSEQGSWKPLNLHGEFDFSDEALKKSLRFDVETLFAFQWQPPAAPFV